MAEWPPRWNKPHFKVGRTRLRKERREAQLKVERKELEQKAQVRRRDGRCRFPLCGCRRLVLALEVSHDDHKGTHGRATRAAVSTSAGMMLLCKHRHQDGAVSRHRKTLETKYLTSRGNDGPVAFLVRRDALRELTVPVPGRTRWVEVARESAIHVLEPLEPWQRELLGELAEMDV